MPSIRQTKQRPHCKSKSTDISISVKLRTPGQSSSSISSKIYLVLTLGLSFACGEEDKNELGGLAASAIEGEWVSDCLSSGDVFEKKAITFTVKTFAFNSTVYSDSECSAVRDKINGEGEFTLGSPVDIAGAGAATEIDYVFSRYTWEFVSDPSTAVDFAAACEEAELVGGTIQVKGKSCTVSASQTIKFHDPSFGVIMVDANDKLLISDASSNGGSIDTRSKSLRIGAGWTKSPENTPTSTD